MYERFISSSMLTGTLFAAISVMWVAGLRHARPEGRAYWSRERSDIEVFYVERVVFDELAARLDLIAHERGEHQVGFRVVLGLHLQQRALRRVHRRFPQRVRVHFSETLIAIDRDALFPSGN